MMIKINHIIMSTSLLSTDIRGSLIVSETITCGGDVIAFYTGTRSASQPTPMVATRIAAQPQAYSAEPIANEIESPSAIDLLIKENNSLKRQMHFLYIEVQNLKEAVFK